PNACQNLDYREKLTTNIDYEIENEQFVSRSKDGSDGGLTRSRKLPLKIIILLVLKCKSSLQRDLDRLYIEVMKTKFNIREVTKGAFTQARAKLNPWAFKRLNEVAVNSFYEGAAYIVWHEMRLLAVDGTRLVLPNHPSVVEEFGVHQFGPKADSPRSL